jgi:hypothetical protein
VIIGFGHGGISPSVLILILFTGRSSSDKLLLESLEDLGAGNEGDELLNF